MKELQQLLGESSGAVLLAADLHVHTPRSQDMDKKWQEATPEDVVQHALTNGMQIIAVTDHNTAEWCHRVQDAAEGTGLHVFPGVEISTPQGHLVAIFDNDKTAEAIHGILLNAGMKQEDLGTDRAVTGENMDKVAERVEREGGVAIAAHVDNPDRGFMNATKVGAQKKAIYECRSIRAFEVGAPERRDVYQAGKMPGYIRRVACIQSSDSRSQAGSQHQLDAIGARHCYLKMDDVSVEGIKQAFLDPDMRVRLTCDERPAPERVIEGMWVTGGFLQGQMFRFSDDLSCLIGGTGVGKSLTVELIRFALAQQTQVKKIYEEVESQLSEALGDGGKVYVLLRRLGHPYLIEREYSSTFETAPVVYSVGDNRQLQPVDDIDVPTFFPIKGYSQSEIIEFTRDAPVRLTLIDDLIDLSGERQTIKTTKGELRTNAAQIIESQRELESAEEILKERGTVKADIKKLEDTLKDERVAKHRLWYGERDALDAAEGTLDELHERAARDFPKLDSPLISDELPDETPNPDVFKQVAEIEGDISKALDTAADDLKEAFTSSQTRLAAVRKGWQLKFDGAEKKYQELLQELDTENVGYQALNTKLLELKARLKELDQKRSEVDTKIKPNLKKLSDRREELLTHLQRQRIAIREKREAKAAELTQALDQRVRVRVRREAERDHFCKALLTIRTGSYLHEEHVRQMADQAHPVAFVKHLLAEEYDQLKEKTGGVEESQFERLREVVLEQNRLTDLYELQIVDLEDRVEVSLKIGDGLYKDLESLAHGQKCTVILSVAMAEGTFPLVADQPEDALHAQFIEEHIVKTLRERRGMRQYVFATRNANVLVSGDAEQVFVLESDAQRGRVERRGSIDRLSTRDLIVLNLEGGAEAFARRSLKYGIEAS